MSLEEIESDVWSEPTFESQLVKTCHKLRKKPLELFTIEDLRIMIGQQISLRILLPLALEQLEIDPLAEGDFYPGDLLAAVLRTEDVFWSNHPDDCERLCRVLRGLRDSPDGSDETDRQTVRDLLQDAAQHKCLRGKAHFPEL